MQGAGVITVTFEVAAVYDAAEELIRVREKLFSRHGDRFRSLQRDIEALGGADLGDMRFHDLGEGHHELQAPRALTDLLVRARALGVI